MLTYSIAQAKEYRTELEELPLWPEGYLGIHHMSIGGDAAFFIYPDDATMLFVARASEKAGFDESAAPLLAAERRPDCSRSSDEWYADCIRNAGLNDELQSLDHAQTCHFDSDHCSYLSDASPRPHNGEYLLSGMTEVAEPIAISTMIDPAYPHYAVPVDLVEIRADDQDLMNSSPSSRHTS